MRHIKHSYLHTCNALSALNLRSFLQPFIQPIQGETVGLCCASLRQWQRQQQHPMDIYIKEVNRGGDKTGL